MGRAGGFLFFRSFPTILRDAWETTQSPCAAAIVRRRHQPAHISTGLTAIELQAAEPLSFDEAFDRMATATAKFNPEKIKMEDVARSGGAADESD